MLEALQSPDDRNDEAVYRLVMTGAATTVEAVAHALGWPIDDALSVLRHLATQGLVRASGKPIPGQGSAADGAVTHWVATPPELVLGPELGRAREQLRRAEQQFASLVEMYHQQHPPRVITELVELVEADMQGARLEQILAAARGDVCAFQTGRNTVAPVARGGVRADVSYRFIVDPAYLREPGALDVLDEWTADGQQVRVVDETLPKVVVADTELALVKVAPSAAVVLHGALAWLAQALFDATWKSARPYLAREAELDRDNVQLLQLMLAGLTDVAMAGQLGASPRTVQRRIRALMEAAGATTRIQLAGYAVRHGWV